MRALLLAAALAGAAPAQDPDAGAAYWHLEPRQPFFEEVGGMLAPRRPLSRARAFARAKAPGTARVFVIGGSVAHQYDSSPERAGGWTLERTLGRAFPGRRFEVVHCGMGGYDSFREELVLREVLGYGADAVVVMSGNNEDRADAGPPSLLAALAVRARRLARRLGLPAAPPRGAPASPARGDFLPAFEANLRRMARLARARGAAVVLCTLPRRLGLPPRETAPPAAHDALRRGRALERRGAAAEALAEYRRALERSCHVPRANAAVRAAAASEGAAVADLESALGPEPGRARNDRLLYDEMHWNRFADARASLSVARALAALWPGADRAWLERDPEGLSRLRPSPAEADEILERELETAFALSADGREAFAENAVALFEEAAAESPARARALCAGPEGARRVEEGLARGLWFRDAAARRPLLASGLLHLGEARRRAGDASGAAACLRAARRYDPGAAAPRPPAAAGAARAFRLDAALVERAFASFRRGGWDAGFRALRAAADGLSPAGRRALLDHCAAPGRDCAPLARARARLREVDDRGVADLLGGRPDRAAEAFDRALRWDPWEPSALMNRGAAAVALGHPEDALAFYGKALEAGSADPGFSSALLSARAEAYERLGRAPEAAADLRRALAQAPPGWAREGEARERLRRLRR